jgi:hypothetical protein
LLGSRPCSEAAHSIAGRRAQAAAASHDLNQSQNHVLLLQQRIRVLEVRTAEGSSSSSSSSSCHSNRGVAAHYDNSLEVTLCRCAEASRDACAYEQYQSSLRRSSSRSSRSSSAKATPLCPLSYHYRFTPLLLVLHVFALRRLISPL